MAERDAGNVKPTIVMRIEEAPEGKPESELKTDRNEDVENNINSQKICTPVKIQPILSTSKFGNSNPFALNNSFGPLKTCNNTVLKPAKLGTSSGIQPIKNPFLLNPSRLNPLTKTDEDDVNDENCGVDKTTNGEGAPKFVPLLDSTSTNSSDVRKSTNTILNTPLQVSQNNFVFGQNLQERVVSDHVNEVTPSTSYPNSNGTSDMLFSTVIKDTVKTDNTESPLKEAKSLSESAREYEESRANKRKYDEVEVITGEEEETNVLHVSCKLFAYDKALGNWQERGRGNIRLNDQDIVTEGRIYKKSRLVFRSSGSLRVILNTKIWADMTIENPSVKSIRLTAIDSCGDIKVFLLMASQEDTAKLYTLLKERLTSEKERQRCKRRILENAQTEETENVKDDM